jgi:hypothetical protein
MHFGLVFWNQYRNYQSIWEIINGCVYARALCKEDHRNRPHNEACARVAPLTTTDDSTTGSYDEIAGSASAERFPLRPEKSLR